MNQVGSLSPALTQHRPKAPLNSKLLPAVLIYTSQKLQPHNSDGLKTYISKVKGKGQSSAFNWKLLTSQGGVLLSG